MQRKTYNEAFLFKKKNTIFDEPSKKENESGKKKSLFNN
jgi:hypothetical protein